MPDQAATSSGTDQSNATFWNELCGTQGAKSLGVVDDSVASLKKFDDWYFDYYPYLTTHIPFDHVASRQVLEIGLGYGTVAQRLAEAGADYVGLDIAPGPVFMVDHRLRQNGLSGSVRQGSILAAPFSDQSFDLVVAIGCLHHTGDLQRAISECYRVLRPGGTLVMMVYYAYSYRRFVQAGKETLEYLWRETIGYRGVVGVSSSVDRAAYDSNQSGEAAPHTDWISIRSLKSYCRLFSSFRATVENIDNGVPFHRAPPREELLRMPYPRWVGLDLYASARK